jgi:hypothetical protein
MTRYINWPFIGFWTIYMAAMVALACFTVDSIKDHRQRRLPHHNAEYWDHKQSETNR